MGCLSFLTLVLQMSVTLIKTCSLLGFLYLYDFILSHRSLRLCLQLAFDLFLHWKNIDCSCKQQQNPTKTFDFMCICMHTQVCAWVPHACSTCGGQKKAPVPGVKEACGSHIDVRKSVQDPCRNSKLSQVVVVRAFYPSTWEAETGESLLSSRPAWSTEPVPGQPRRIANS